MWWYRYPVSLGGLHENCKIKDTLPQRIQWRWEENHWLTTRGEKNSGFYVELTWYRLLNYCNHNSSNLWFTLMHLPHTLSLVPYLLKGTFSFPPDLIRLYFWETYALEQESKYVTQLWGRGISMPGINSTHPDKWCRWKHFCFIDISGEGISFLKFEFFRIDIFRALSSGFVSIAAT